jgi:hypothetical protein
MRDKPAHCQAELVLTTPVVICDNPTTVYFKLAKPYTPHMMGPPLPGFWTIDACDDHSASIEQMLTNGGHQPKCVKV